MIYFQTIKLDYLESDATEDLIRKASIKSAAHLDFSSSNYHSITNKKFFGHETSEYLIITRIRGPIEKYLPKFIVKFDKQLGFIEYKIRLSFLSTLLLGLILIFLISRLLALINIGELSSLFCLPIVLIFSIVFLFLQEIKTIKKIINRETINTINTV